MYKVIVLGMAMFIASQASVAGNEDTMRCGKGLVMLGMNFSQLKDACGKHWKPARIEKLIRTEADPHYRYSDGTIPVTSHPIEKWTYAFYGKFVTVVSFEDGRVYRIFRTSDRHLK